MKIVPYTNTTGVAVKASPGTLGKLIIWTPANAGTIKMYDAASAAGTAIVDITLEATALKVPVSIPIEAEFKTGLWLVVTGAIQLSVVFD